MMREYIVVTAKARLTRLDFSRVALVLHPLRPELLQQELGTSKRDYRGPTQADFFV